MNNIKIIILLISFVLSTQFNYAQNGFQTYYIQDNSGLNTITTAVPFLIINPHAQSMGIADIGVVASEEYYESGFTQNPALLSRYKKVIGGKMSYMPWLKQLVPDIRMYDANFYFSPNQKNTIGFSYNRFSLGDVTYTDVNGSVVGQYRPVESYYNLRYAHSVDSNLSLGAGLKYIVSDLTGGVAINGTPTYTGRALAADIGLDYHKKIVSTETNFLRYDLGVSIINIGNKMRYSDDGHADFLPTQLSLGAMLTYTKKLNEYLKYGMDLAYQCEKLLVPTPPIYKHKTDSLGRDMGVEYDASGNPVIFKGKDPNRSVANAMITSFYDAPGGSSEEVAEILHKVGIENRLIVQDDSYFAVRLGYLNEARTKGNRKYVTFGMGGKYKYVFLNGGMILYYKWGNVYQSGIKFPFSWNITLGFKYDF